MLKKKACVLIALVTLVLSFALFAGCAQQERARGEDASTSHIGTIILRVNPEIALQYNAAAQVTGLTGLNSDGRAIVDAYDDYIGKDAQTVVQELVTDIGEAGYFAPAEDGSVRSITVQLTPESILPQDDFMQVLAGEAQAAALGLNVNPQIIDIGPGDYTSGTGAQGFSGSAAASSNSSSTAAAPSQDASINRQKAQEIALQHAGLNTSQVSDLEVDRSSNNGRWYYEVEFSQGGIDYEYQIDAATGRILNYERDTKTSAPPATTSPAPGNTTQSPAPTPYYDDDDDDWDDDWDDDDYDDDDDDDYDDDDWDDDDD